MNTIVRLGSSYLIIPYKYKMAGIILILVGTLLTTVYFIHRVDITIPVFAISSSYLDTRYFAIINTNILEELIFLIYLVGFLLTVFSREKIEHNEYSKIRCEAWKSAVLLNSIFLAFFILFIYGKGFMIMLIANMFSIFVFYLIVFQVKKAGLKKRLSKEIS